MTLNYLFILPALGCGNETARLGRLRKPVGTTAGSPGCPPTRASAGAALLPSAAPSRLPPTPPIASSSYAVLELLRGGRSPPRLSYNYRAVTGLAVSVKGLEYRRGCHPTCSLRALDLPLLRACPLRLGFSSLCSLPYYLPLFTIFRVIGFFVPFGLSHKQQLVPYSLTK